MAHSSVQDNMNFEFFLNEKNYLNPELTTEDLKVFRRSEKQFKRMMNEILMLDEHIVQDKVYLAEYKLSPSTRAYYNKIKNSDFTLLTEEDATDSQQPVDANEIPKKILGLINKFHTDNKDDLDVVSGDEKYRTILPQNIGKEPSILQKIVKGAQNLKGKSSNIAVKILTSILANSLEKIEKWYSTTKKNLIDAAKQGTLFSQIESQFLPSLKIAVRDPATGEITYTSDTEGPGLWNWLKAFVQRNPIWTNFIIGILINLVKIGATLYFGPLGGVVVGALFGIVLRSLVGRLKGESWGTAIKKAVIVTGMSILGGALTKGLFSAIRGGGFFSGFKSYFVGDAVQIAQDTAAKAISNQTLDAKAIAYAKAMKSAKDWYQFKNTPEYNEMLKNIARSDSSMSSSGAAKKIAAFFADKDKMSDAQLQSYFKSNLSDRLAILTKQGVPPDKIFSNSASATIDKETAAQQALQQYGGFKPANPEVAKQILAKAGLPADATSERVFSKGVKGVFGTMSMDPEEPFAESTNKLNRFLLNYVKESSSQGQSGLSANGFFNYLSSKTGVPIKSLSQMIAGEDDGEIALVKQHLTQVLNQAAANTDAGETAKDTLYAFSREMMGNLSDKMQQSPTLMRDFGVSAVDVAKQSAINQAKNAGTQMILSAPQSLGSLGLDESIYKKMMKNLI